MALKDRRACPPCCKNPTECDHCGEKCIPRYLCVNATITGPYGECHCDSIDMRIFPTSGCGWSGEVYCGEDSLTVTVTLEKLRGTCFTHVVVPEIELDTMFEGVIQDVAFTGTDYNGVEYDVTITPAQMVENPLAYGNCPICSCATCLPAAFCVFFTDLYGEIYSATLNWDCTSRQYPVVEVTDGMSVEILLGTDTCKLTVNATGGSVDINLESSEPDPTDGGIICLESTGYVTKGKPPFASIEQPGIITATIAVPTGTVRVVEKSCNGACTACPDATPNNGECCPYLPESLELTVRCTSTGGCDETQTVTAFYSLGYTYTFRFCDIAEDIVIVLDCESDLITENEWTVTLTSATHGGRGTRKANLILCPGILIHAVFSLTIFGMGTYTFDITATR